MARSGFISWVAGKVPSTELSRDFRWVGAVQDDCRMIASVCKMVRPVEAMRTSNANWLSAASSRMDHAGRMR